MKAFMILGAFRRPDECLTSAELSRRARLPEASGYRLVQTLESVGAVVRERGLYRPGFLLGAPTGQGPQRQALSEAAQGLLEGLADRFGATAHLGILEHGMVTYLAKASARTCVAVTTKVGAQQEAYCSAIGKVLLAALTEPELESFLREGELIPLTERTITQPAEFREEIERVRQTGFALDRGEAHAHLSCVAVPVLGRNGATVAALSVVDRITIMDDGRRAHARMELSLAAEAISRRLASAVAVRRSAATLPASESGIPGVGRPCPRLGESAASAIAAPS